MSLESIGKIEIVNSKCTYKWVIPNFSEKSLTRPGEKMTSPVFTTEAHGVSHKWRLFLYPQGKNEDYEGYLSICLFSCNDYTIEAAFSFDVSYQGYALRKLESGYHTFKPEKKDWGWYAFVERHELRTTNILIEDKLRVSCEISINTFYEKKSKVSPSNAVQIPEPISKLANDFGKLFDNQKFSDFKFIIGDKTLHAHKIILSMRSPVFAAMFDTEMEENEKNEVEITDISYEVFRSLLQYIYCGEVKEFEDVAMELMFAADKYQLNDLKPVLEMCLIKKLSVENALQVYNTADLHGAQQLKEETKSFMIKHAKEIVKNPEFRTILQLHGDIVIEVMKTLVLQE